MTDSYTVSVVAPAYNEEASLPTLASRLLRATEKAGIGCELIIVDDGSDDNTWKVIAGLTEEWGDAVRGIQHGDNRGIPASWQTGVEEARGEYVCLIDADLQNPPEQVVTLYRRLLESRADIAQGTRSSIERDRDSRLLFSKGLNLMLNMAFGDGAQDSKSGFLLAPRRVVADIVEHRGRYNHFQTFIRVAARAKGYTFVEVETLFQPRRTGESFLAGRRAWEVSGQALADFPRALREFGRGRREPIDGTVAPRNKPVPKAKHPYDGWRRAWFEAYFATMPAHKWLIRRRARAIYLELKRIERLPANEIRDLQLRKLQRLVQHARVHVPYYREVLRDGDWISHLDDITQLPLLDKSTIRERLYFDLFSDTHRKRDMHKIATSGSTGEPFVTYADRYQLEVRFATTLRSMEWTGWRFGDKQARLWHQTLGMSKTQVARERIDAFFMRRLFIPAFEISPETLDDFVAEIREWDPVLVDGYAESLNFLASYLREGRSAGFSPSAVMSSAQVLPEQVKRSIEGGLNTRVFDKYGSREFSGIAYQCEASDDHHVMDESYLVEVLVEGRPAKPGEVGEVVITDLNNYSVPLIRYRVGDLAQAVDQSQPCPCGRGLSRIGRIEGRTQAIVHCADGTWMPGTFFAHFFKDFDYIVRLFQIHQVEKGSFTLRLVRGPQWTEEGETEMLQILSGFIGDTVVTVEHVDEIPLLRTGKRSPVVSDVREDFQGL
ncbi:MAG: glycosyltransferase [Candidatus Nanopelagicales bacterium]|nr:glycosyltransferase [Candidatus Nanopelagicales bacterium]